MKLLLDTHILIWWLDDDSKLTNEARQIIQNPDNDIFISHVSLWEIQIKSMSGKLKADVETIIQQLPENGFQQLAMHPNHILALAKLPPHHQDPFDRILIAQALSEPLHLLTHDKVVAQYNESIMLI
jgi:PIN domain nuclease of toxin-antitoxin system